MTSTILCIYLDFSIYNYLSNLSICQYLVLNLVEYLCLVIYIIFFTRNRLDITLILKLITEFVMLRA